MGWYIGIDGGGTKTAFCLGKEDGKPLYCLRKTGCSYQSIGVEAVADLLKNGVNELLEEAGLTAEDCKGCCIGLPCFGENKHMDALISDRIKRLLSPIPVYIVNDGVVGWAGSLECAEGVHLVAGTGSIAFGMGADKKMVRTGGWCEFFGDEGSCYWVGRKVMSLFSKQADGRFPKTALYHIIKEEYNFEDDFEFVDYVLKNIAPYRERVAAFQIYCHKAAMQGDEYAAKLYVDAAERLAQFVSGVIKQLKWSKDEITVSYFGGIFHAGEFVLRPLEFELAKYNCKLVPPKKTATEGALLLSINTFNK